MKKNRVDFKIKKVPQMRGVLSIPGDKSISHRALMISALTLDEVKISNFSTSVDCEQTLNCLKDLGANFQKVEPDSILVSGTGLRGFKEPENVLEAGNSGTTVRLVSGILAGQDFFSVITGDASVRARPMGRITKPLRLMGARVWGREDGEYVPLAIMGGKLRGITYRTPVSSAQIKSAILLASLYAEGETLLEEPALSRDHTERMLSYFEADIQSSEDINKIRGGKSLVGKDIEVPGDFSSAAYFIAASLIVPDSKLVLRNVGINPTRTGFLEIVKEMGAQIKIVEENWKCNEPRADLAVETSRLKGIEIGGEIIPRIIDEIPILTVLATQAEGRTIIREAEELRVKETDRIKSMAEGLKKMGAHIEEEKGGFIIDGPTPLKGSTVSSYDDHRTAMSLAIAGMIAEGETIIKGAECIEISFPEFPSLLSQFLEPREEKQRKKFFDEEV